jgi:hypothetical protein
VRTESSLLGLLRHDPKDRNNLDHDLNDNLRHGHRRSDGNIFLKPHKKIFHAAEQIDESILSSADVFNGLRVYIYHQDVYTRSKKVLTWSRAPIPVKIAAAGGNTCDNARQRVVLKRLNVSRFTGPAMLLTKPENAYSTVMVGFSNLVHLSFALGDGSNVWTCV